MSCCRVFLTTRRKNKERRAGELIAKNMNFVMVFGSAIIVLLILLADPIVALLGGSDFADSEVPLRCVGVAVMFSAMNIVLANYMISKGKERSWATVNAIGLVLAVVANCVLIPASVWSARQSAFPCAKR